MKLEECHKNRHWYQTHVIAWTFLRRLKSKLEIEDVKTLFAHTNSAKCSMMNKNHRQSHWRLFENCRPFIVKEVEILEPDVIVTQGNAARSVIEDGFPVKKEEAASEVCPFWTLDFGDKQALWFHTYHPSFFGGYWRKKRECFEAWADVIQARFGE